MDRGQHHPPASSSKEEGEKLQLKAPFIEEKRKTSAKALSCLEEGVGGGGVSRGTLLRRAAEMRKNLTEPERRLWTELRASRFGGHKFRRQQIIGNWIVDFFCPAKGLVIEIDGDTHDAEADNVRDRLMLAKYGFATVRFTNEDAMRNLDGVMDRLKAVLEDASDRWMSKKGTTPRPPPLKRRRKERYDKAPSSSEEGVGGGGNP